ncbi:MAG: alkaline phosphatase family protein, partial [Blastocatellia bacterium]
MNFTELANRERLSPITRKPLAIHEPLEDSEEFENKAIPTGANTPGDENRASTPSGITAVSPALASSFPALDDDNTRIPSDTHGAAGPNHLMVALNSQVRVQTRNGGTINTVSLNGFWAAFGHPNVFDTRIYYDSFAARWIFISLADFRAATSALLIGVSQTGDPTGNWNLFNIDADAADLVFVDYPNVGFNKDWIVATANAYRISDKEFVTSNIYVFNKTALYAGSGSPFTLFQDSSGTSQVPAITYDNTLSTIYIIENWNGNAGGTGALRLSKITGAVGSESLSLGIAFPSTPNPWDNAPPGSGNFAPQLGSSQNINDGDAVAQNLVYRNGSLWCAQTVFLPAGGAATRSAVQWWQLSTSGAIQQRGRVDDPSGNVFYGFPSIAVNKNNDVLIGYSRFSASQYAGASYSFRASSDPVNTLRDPAVLKDGQAPYVKTNGGTRNKWGDYSSTIVDPLNDLDMWTIQAYAASPSGGIDRWGTWWGRLALAPASPAASEIVLYASEASVKAGNWQVVADPTAAGGNRIFNPDAGQAKVVTPSANPTSYFEMTFTAQAGTPYHMWFRSKALNDNPFNDSVHIQYSDSVDQNGAAVYRIGTTTSTEMNLEECSGCGLSGWGWQDNGWGGVGVLGPAIYFQTSGQHTMRVQVREDGISIDQIVLSPATYLSTPPGPAKNDATIIPKPGGSPAPTISGISPVSGSVSGGTSVTISGSNYAAGASVVIGGVTATSVNVVSGSTITAVTGAHAMGAANVVVTNSDGQSATLVNGYTFVANAVVPQLGHVFILVEENHSYSSVIGSSMMPYLNSLAARYGLAANYFANTHPSIGDYFWLTTGQVITNNSNFAGTVSEDNIVRQLVAAGKTWKSYAESLPAVGYTGTDQYPYVKRHNPFAYFTDVINSPAQAGKLVPFSQFGTDLTNNQLPDYSFIIPNQYNNAHDCPQNLPSCTDADKLAAADNWLSTNIAPLIASPAFQQDGLLVIVFDESIDADTAGGGGQVAALVISPRAKPGYRSTTFYQHQSVLRMTAEALGLTSFPGAAATAPNMLDLFDTSTSPAPAISSISPNSGTTNGGTSATISGSGFTTGATVSFGGSPATNINVTNGASITATTPAHAAGIVNVAVTNTNGLRSTLSGGYTYTTAPPTETVLLADDFNDNALNSIKWAISNLFSGFTDAGLPTLETNQRLEIGPMLQQAGGSHYNGL